MSIPSNLALFRFPGFGPDLGHGLVVKTGGGRVLVAEAVTNPGVPLIDTIDTATPIAAREVGVDLDAAEFYVFTPDDPLQPESLWRVTLGDDGPQWHAAEWQSDPDLKAGVMALNRALGRSVPASE